jgi:hypothetical protein
MNHRMPSRLYRTFASAMCAVLLYSTAAAGINEGVTATAEFLQQKLRLPAREFTEKPTKVFKGTNPRRDEGRSDWWTPRLKVDRAKIKMDRAMERLGEEGIFASIEEIPVLLLQGEGGAGGGGNPPGEGGGGSGGSGGAGGAGGAGNGGTGSGVSGESNTNTGNNLHTYPIVGWTSLGDSNIGITLYHSSRDEDEGLFGMGWNSTYEAKISYTSGSSAIVKMPDGLEMPYAEASGGNSDKEDHFIAGCLARLLCNDSCPNSIGSWKELSDSMFGGTVSQGDALATDDGWDFANDYLNGLNGGDFGLDPVAFCKFGASQSQWGSGPDF